MLSKDFENFELRLQNLREASQESFHSAEKIFTEKYMPLMREVFPRDILGVKKYIAGFFIIDYAGKKSMGKKIVSDEIFVGALQKSFGNIPLNQENKEKLILHIQSLLYKKEIGNTEKNAHISRDPFFILVEEFSIDGNISQEEFAILEQSYTQRGNFIEAIESLPTSLKKLFTQHIELLLQERGNEKKQEFESEYANELQGLEEKGYNTQKLIVFVARSYYKTPGKMGKYEHPKRRLRRTFKMALLRLLRMKLGNIDAEHILERFENGESFDDFFILLYQLMEIIDENPQNEELYTQKLIEEETEKIVFTAEENKQRILDGESLVMRIAGLFSKTDASLEEGILGKILDENTHFIGDDVHFAHTDNSHAGIYAQSEESSQDEEDEDEIDFDTMSPETAYEILKHQFQKCEEEKRNAFLIGEYEKIDSINEALLNIESKLSKLTKILGSDE